MKAVITLADLKDVLGRRLVRRLVEAKLIVPSTYDGRGHPLFDAQSLHRTLGALARAVGLIEPQPYQPGNAARRTSKNDELDELLSDLARSLE